MNSSDLDDRSLCQIASVRFLSYCYLCLSSAGEDDNDAADVKEEMGVAQDILVGVLEDLSSPTHLHLVSFYYMKFRRFIFHNNPKIPPSACLGTLSLSILQKAEPPRCLVLRTRGGR